MLRKFLTEIIIGGTFFTLLIIGVVKYGKMREKYADLKVANETAQTALVQYKKLNDSLVVAYTKPQVVTEQTAQILFKKELEEFKAQTGKGIKDLQSLFKTQINGQNTLIINNIDTNSCDSLYLSHKDRYNEVEVLVNDGTAVINTTNRTYLTKYTYMARRGAPWYKPWKWGKDLRVEIKSDNPKDSILDIKEIIIRK